MPGVEPHLGEDHDLIDANRAGFLDFVQEPRFPSETEGTRHRGYGDVVLTIMDKHRKDDVSRRYVALPDGLPDRWAPPVPSGA